MSLTGEAIAEFLNALSAACAIHPVDRRRGIVESLIAVERFLADLSGYQSADSFKALNLAISLRLHAEDKSSSRLPPFASG
jgi:hypothetical protein